MSDLISRQAAIAHAVPLNLFGREVMMVSVSELENLPSAQPEQRYTEEELRVFQHGISLSLLSKRSAQYWQYDADTAIEIEFLERLYDKVVADMRGEPMDDLISRQAAIDELRDVIVKDVQFGDELTDGYNDGIDMAITVISKLKSAQRTGKWLDYLKEGLKYKCSECESRFDRPYKYCPNCGARMDEE